MKTPWVGGRSKVKMFSSKIRRNQNQIFRSLDIGQAQLQNIIGNTKECKKEQTIWHNASRRSNARVTWSDIWATTGGSEWQSLVESQKPSS